MGFFKKTKELKKGLLTDIEVDLISLLYDDMKPANRMGTIIKCEGVTYHQTGSSNMVKSDDEGRAYVTVIVPDAKDTQGDFTNKEEIQKACDRFAQGGMKLRNDVNHDMQAVPDCVVVESYILKTADKEHFPNTPIGSWVVVIKFNDLKSELWKKVKEGKFNGVSLYGRAHDDNSAVLEKEKDDALKVIETLKDLNDPIAKPVIEKLEKQYKELENMSDNATINKHMVELRKDLSGVMTLVSKAINTQIKHEEPAETDKEITISGEKVLVKAEYSELYKAIGGVDSGSKMNVLSDNLGEQFIDVVVDFIPSDVFTDITVAALDKFKSIDKGFIEDIVLQNISDGAVADQIVEDFDIKCHTDELNGILQLKHTTVEMYRDKYGEEKFGAYVVQKLREKIQKALIKLLFMGQRSSTDPTIKGIDGFITRMTATDEHIVINRTAGDKYEDIFDRALQSYTNDALSDRGKFLIYCSPKTYLAIQSEYRQRPTALGDKFLMQDGKLYFNGLQIKERIMPDDVFIIGLAKFLILGYFVDATIKVEHSGRDWAWRWFVRTDFGTQYIKGGLVKYFEIA